LLWTCSRVTFKLRPASPLPVLAALVRRAEAFSESRLAVLVPICLYLLMASARLATNDPWVDEGWFASSAVNLVRDGFMGKTLLVSDDFPNLDRYTYWLPPLHFVTQAVMYRVAGVGLYQMRCISLIFGLLAFYGVYRLSLRVFRGSRPLTILALTLVATNFFYLKAATDGRMDMMAASLFLVGISTYLGYREQNLGKALLCSNALVCMSGLAHPNGLLGLIVLAFLVLHLDRNRITPKSLSLGLLPYLVGGLAWGAYIAQDYDSFRAQLLTNTIGQEQKGEFASGPKLESVYYEVVNRYLKCYGYISEEQGLIRRTPAPVLAFYLLCFVGFPFYARNRSKLLWCILLIVFLGLMFLVGNKTCTYLVWITPLFLLNSINLASCARRSRPLGIFFSLAFAYVLVFSLASNLHLIYEDEYHRVYLDDVRAFNSTHYRGGLIHGSGELAFFYDFDDEVLQDDRTLGVRTGVRPDYIAISPIYLKTFDRYEEYDPELYESVANRLAEDYVPVYAGRKYTFYEKLQK
jgi:4-amino-4-deoxy-L-arabinose transferase-like glycosyltransferase